MGVPDNIDGLERQRLELESNIFQLQQSLYHWRTWEAEYDGLKETISELDDDATLDDFLRVGRDFDGTLVNEDEVRVIIGEKNGLKRNKQQVSSLISRRIDYVRDNVALMEKRLRAAETELEVLDSVEQSQGEQVNFPMKEIIEELDEDGKIISSKTTTPGDQASDLLDILKQAGVQDIPDHPKPDVSDLSSSQSKKEEESRVAPSTVQDEPVTTESNGNSAVSRDLSPLLEPSAESDKEVPIVDVDESPDDAKLRREMLQYSLDEVGAVVAELEFDDEASDVSIDDVDDSYSYEDGDEEEDEYGRSTGPVLDDDYHQRMRELEAKLNARGMWNVGKDTASLPEDMKKDLEQPGRVKREKTPDSNGEPPELVAKLKSKPRKKVAFADELDIAPASSPVPEDKKVVPLEQTEVTVLSDSIIERTQSMVKNPAMSYPPTPKKSSRFKSARGIGGTVPDAAVPSGNLQSSKPPASQRKITPLSATPSMPLFPAKPTEPKPFSQPISDVLETTPSSSKANNKILADTLIERDITEAAANAPELDELDEELHLKEIASDFHKLRSRMMKQNGESHDDESEMVPVEPEEAPMRISKFRASRMG
ncbi:Prefoldin subunit-domain-containing protein [Aspergillus crustosus]